MTVTCRFFNPGLSPALQEEKVLSVSRQNWDMGSSLHKSMVVGKDWSSLLTRDRFEC